MTGEAEEVRELAEQLVGWYVRNGRVACELAAHLVAEGYRLVPAAPVEGRGVLLERWSAYVANCEREGGAFNMGKAQAFRHAAKALADLAPAVAAAPAATGEKGGPGLAVDGDACPNGWAGCAESYNGGHACERKVHHPGRCRCVCGATTTRPAATGEEGGEEDG